MIVTTNSVNNILINMNSVIKNRIAQVQIQVQIHILLVHYHPQYQSWLNLELNLTCLLKNPHFFNLINASTVHSLFFPLILCTQNSKNISLCKSIILYPIEISRTKRFPLLDFVLGRVYIGFVWCLILLNYQ